MPLPEPAQQLTVPLDRKRHIDALDGVRGFAVLIVFFFHYGGGTHSSFTPMRIFGLINKGGWSGVVLFFVLSGFLITGILWDGYSDPSWWRKFFIRRSLRIFPLYFLTLILLILAAVPGGTVGEVLKWIWIPVLFLENMPVLDNISGNLASPLPIFHLWSIAVEEQFYLLWPWLLHWCWSRIGAKDNRSVAKNACLMIFGGSVVFRILIWGLYPKPNEFSHFLLSQAGALAAGAWLALACRGPEWARISRLAPRVAAAGLAGFVTIAILSHGFEAESNLMMVVGLPAITIFFAGILAAALQHGLCARFFSIGWLRSLGNISYGVYVFHVLLLVPIEWIARHLVGNRGPMALNILQFVVAAALSLGCAILSFQLFESRILSLKKYFMSQPVANPNL